MERVRGNFIKYKPEGSHIDLSHKLPPSSHFIACNLSLQGQEGNWISCLLNPPRDSWQRKAGNPRLIWHSHGVVRNNSDGEGMSEAGTKKPVLSAPISPCVLDSSLCHRNYKEGEETPSLVPPKHSPWDGPPGMYPGNEAMLGWSPRTTSHLWGDISQGQWTEQQVQSFVFTWQESGLVYFNLFIYLFLQARSQEMIENVLEL